MREIDVNTFEAPEYDHGLIGLGTIFYKYYKQSETLEILINYNPASKDNQIVKKIEGSDAKKTWMELIDIDGIVDNFNIDDVFRAIYDISGYNKEHLSSRNRKEDVVFSRQLIMWSAKKHLKLTLAKAGALVLRNHATALYAYKQMERPDKFMDYWQASLRIEFKKRLANLARERQIKKLKQQ
jgi:hypothetical protein